MLIYCFEYIVIQIAKTLFVCVNICNIKYPKNFSNHCRHSQVERLGFMSLTVLQELRCYVRFLKTWIKIYTNDVHIYRLLC